MHADAREQEALFAGRVTKECLLRHGTYRLPGWVWHCRSVYPLVCSAKCRPWSLPMGGDDGGDASSVTVSVIVDVFLRPASGGNGFDSLFLSVERLC